MHLLYLSFSFASNWFLFEVHFFLRYWFTCSKYLSWIKSFHILESSSCSWNPFVLNDFSLFSSSQRIYYVGAFQRSKTTWLSNQDIKTKFSNSDNLVCVVNSIFLRSGYYLPCYTFNILTQLPSSFSIRVNEGHIFCRWVNGGTT